MFRRVFVPVDGRPDPAAIRLAARLVRRGGRLRACYVVDRALVRMAFLPFRERLGTDLEAEGRRALAKVEAVCRKAGVPCSVTSATGDVTTEVVEAARRFRADLMVVTTSRPGPIAAALFGSRTRSLANRSPCPVLLVPRQSRRRPAKRRERPAAPGGEPGAGPGASAP